MKTKEIADLVKGELVGDEDVEISRVAALEDASNGDISFIEAAGAIDRLEQVSASCLLIPQNSEIKTTCPSIQVKNPKYAFATIAAELHPFRKSSGWHETISIPDKSDVRARFIGAFVSIGENTNIGEGSEIHDGSRVGRNVTIGNSSIVNPNCVIYDNVTIGNNCVIHSGSVIGADGFGFVRGEDEYIKFPQIGTVVIEDNVEVGANSCIDRGALGETRIGEGTKIDNLVQVAHNVTIGKRVVIASQTGISGSVTIEDDCVIGGQVGFGDHCTVESGAVIGSQAGVLPGKIVREGVWWGTPVKPLRDYKRLNAHINSLPRLKQEIKTLRQLISELEKE
ncbi:MAG: UDP-3-O-(3-hydroxymyristoyl)glucosamine N-acyltransferase [Pyrinomonadaceae bacterium]|nr:UDP-3-O-(3-hydroxymyristoyl)glucosamine N-acyltransferase [Pyrinomonadaceae bacterium]